MTLLWNIRFIFLVLLEIITSTFFIYKRKYRTSYLTEILLSLLSIAYAYRGIPYLLKHCNIQFIQEIYSNHTFTLDKLFIYVILYFVMKILLVIWIWLIKYFSFYALVSITKNGLIARVCYKIFGKTKFSHFVSVMWNRVEYGLPVKKGVPGMVNKKHKKTGIKFDKNGFPIFKPKAEVRLGWRLHRKSRAIHFRHANKILYKKIKRDKNLARKFTKVEIELLRKGETPAKYVWHHHQDRGRLQLVEDDIHSKVNHRGGFSIWGEK